MRKTYKLFLTLMLCIAGVMNASAGKADLDPAMFKAWNGWEAGATVAEDQESVTFDGNAISCQYRLYENVGSGTVIYGHDYVYYLWYADLTGTNTITFEGTPGMQLRVLFNRPAPDEGAEDQHGGKNEELNVTIGDDGTAVVDMTPYSFIHLNAIKTGWGSPAGTLRKIELDGKVKAVTGWVDMVENGDMEGTDVTSFAQSLDAVNNPGFEPAVISDGVGKDGSRGIKVTSMDNPTQTWATQFFIRSNEFLPEGTQWRLEFDYRANREADTNGGCHGEPRDYHAGAMFTYPHFSTEWQHFEASGTITADQAKDTGFKSIAFDLNNETSATEYYFDNVSFQVYRESSPISLITTAYGADVVRIDFGKDTNMKDLVKAAGGQRVVYPNDCAGVTVNGQAATLLSVEGRPDGYLYIFIDEGYPEGDGEDVVAVSFTNPTDADKQIIYTTGKYEGEPVPTFANIMASYQFELSENFSYLYSTPEIVVADPEDGSFNLPVGMKEFKLEFDHEVNCAELKATLDKEQLAVSPAEGLSKNITLTRTGSGDLAEGVHIITLENVVGEKDLGDTGEYTLTLGFGPLKLDPNDQPTDIIPISLMNDCAFGDIPEGFQVTFDDGAETRIAGTNYGSGPRTWEFAAGGDFTKALYTRNGYIEYGVLEGHALSLEAGKKYAISFNTARWKANGQYWKFEIFDDLGTAQFTQIIENNPDVNGQNNQPAKGTTVFSTNFYPEMTGNYILRWSVCNESGDVITSGYTEPLLANVLMRYLPSTLGVEETALLNNALENAKSVRDANSGERYAGAAMEALVAKINEYTDVTLTAPSAFRKAADELNAAAKGVQDHRELCDTYDPLPAQAQGIVDTHAVDKFAATSLYKQIANVAAKYAIKTDEVSTDPETGQEIHKPVVTPKLITLDSELKTAIDELNNIVALGNSFFTEGESRVGDAGVKVLVERLRLGALTLKSLGIDENDELVQKATNALHDSDNLAEAVKNRIKEAIYGKLKDASNDMFKPTVNPETLEEQPTTYDMTVFVKNPNIYVNQYSEGISAENVPGWVVTGASGLFVSWGGSKGIQGLPEDCAFTIYHNAGRMEQTVTDLPAGIYTVTVDAARWDDPEPSGQTFAYYKTSATPAVAEGEEEVKEVNFAGTADLANYGQYVMNHNNDFENVAIVDGIVTLGVNYASDNGQYMFDKVRLTLTGAANGFDYGKAYDAILAGIDETVAKPANVRAMDIFDLNGRRVNASQKGIVIVRKLMSDGTIVTEKVIKK